MSAWGPLGGYPLASPQAAAVAPAGLPALTTSTYKPGTLASSGWTPRITADSGASCDLYYLAVPVGSTAPTAAQIVAGVDYGAVTVLAAGSVAYTSAGTYDADSAPVTGASASTNYDQWWVAFDGTDYGTPVSGGITTAAAAASLTATLDAGYSVAASRTTALAAGYAVAAQHTDTLNSAYAVAANQTVTLAAGYSVAARHTATLAAGYGVEQAHVATLTAGYAVAAQQSATLDAAYAIRASQLSTLAAGYSIRASHSATLDAGYAVEQAAGSFTTTLAAGFAVQASHSATLSAAFGVRQSHSDTLDAGYAIRQSQSATLSAAYAVRAAHLVTLDAGYAVAFAGGGADPEAVWEGFALEAGLTPGAMLRIVMAAVAGRTEGIGTSTERYFSVDGSKPRITATFDSAGNRTTIVLDGSP